MSICRFLGVRTCWVGLAAVLGGCTVLRIENADVTEHRYPGVTVLTVTPRQDYAAVITTTGFGLTFAVNGAALGYLGETTFVASGTTTCRTFIVVLTPAEAQALRRAIEVGSATKDLCILQPREE